MTDLPNKFDAAIEILKTQGQAPRFNSLGPIFATGKTVVTDVDGNLWQIDANVGTVRRVVLV
jgi:hypothetical protein